MPLILFVSQSFSLWLVLFIFFSHAHDAAFGLAASIHLFSVVILHVLREQTPIVHIFSSTAAVLFFPLDQNYKWLPVFCFDVWFCRNSRCECEFSVYEHEQQHFMHVRRERERFVSGTIVHSILRIYRLGMSVEALSNSHWKTLATTNARAIIPYDWDTPFPLSLVFTRRRWTHNFSFCNRNIYFDIR